MTRTAGLRIGCIGVDSSHVIAFTRGLRERPGRYQGAGISAVLDIGPTTDFAPSRERHGRLVRSARELGLPVVDSWDALDRLSDAVAITASDPRRHPELLTRASALGKPIYVDTRLAHDSQAAGAAAQVHCTDAAFVLSPKVASENFRTAIDTFTDPIDGIDLYGPLIEQPPLGPFTWYGIHMAQMLYQALGPGCASVWANETDGTKTVVARWKDGRAGTMQGPGHFESFTRGVVHNAAQTVTFTVDAESPGFYDGLLTTMVEVLSGKTVAPSIGQLSSSACTAVEIAHFLDAANRSLTTGLLAHL